MKADHDLARILENEGAKVSLEPFIAEETNCWQVKTTGKNCMKLWRSLRKIVDATGHWPVILGNNESLRLLLESADDIDDWRTFHQDTLEKASRLDSV